MEIHCRFEPSPHWSMSFPSDFRSLKVVAQGAGDPEVLSSAVEGMGRADGANHVFLDRAALVRLAGNVAQAPGWSTGFDAMVAYADAHGWTDQTGALRAHVEWVS